MELNKDRFIFYSKSDDNKPGKNKGTEWSEYVKDIYDLSKVSKFTSEMIDRILA